MKYLYYSLYLFYVKIIRVQNDWPPIISITGVISFLISSLSFSFYDAYQYSIGVRHPLFSIFIWIGLSLLLYEILYDYYKPREAKLIKEMDRKPLWQKIVIVLLSVLFIITVVKLWMFEGMNEVYQFIKQLLIR